MKCSVQCLSFALPFLLLLFHLPPSALATKELRLLVLLPAQPSFPFALGRVRRMLPFIREGLRERRLLQQLDVKFIWRDSTCTNLAALPAFEHICDGRKKVHAFLGLVCSFSAAQVVIYSRAKWRLPVVSFGASSHKFRDPDISLANQQGDILTRCFVTYNDVAKVLLRHIFHHLFGGVGGGLVNRRGQRRKRRGVTRFTGIYVEHLKANPLEPSSCLNFMSALNAERQINMTGVQLELRAGTTDEKLTPEIIENMLRKAVGIDNAIVVLCADPDSVRKIMLKAQSMNFINGEYVFFNIDLFSSKNQSLKPWYRANETEENNNRARQAYRALMTITLRKPDSQAYRAFSDNVKNRALKSYNYSYGEQEVNSFVGAFYDSVMLYALALNDSLSMGGKIEDGLNITRLMWGRTFTGITGNVSIDGNGDRNADYSLLDMNPDTGDFEVVANYYGNAKEYVSVPGKTIDWANEQQKAPPDIPPCGYNRSGCPDRLFDKGVAAALIMASLIAVALIVGIVVYRRMKFQAQLMAMNWIIHWEELETQERRNRRRRSSKRKVYPDTFEKEMPPENHFLLSEAKDGEETKGSKGQEKSGREEKGFRYTFVRDLQNRITNKRKSKWRRRQLQNVCVFKVTTNAHRSLNGSLQSMSDTRSASSLDTIAGIQLSSLQSAQMFTKTSFYKDQIVALKKMNVRSRKIDITHDLLIEVKRIKDLNNDHIARFIGACIEPPNECIITEYCPKGSLQDVLENDQINLDWMFKFSLMQDICRGLIYLHNNLGPHGNLKSSNCLVDSRFVLKITDFALHALRGPSDLSEEEDAYQFYRNKLWTAPELLRVSGSAQAGTIKGDTYSFAIVCQEIVYRKGVFYFSDQELEPKKIVQGVRSGERPVLRPTLDTDEGCSEEMVRIISQAWSEDPAERPELTQVKIQMKKVNRGGDSGNLLDNLLSRMEQYANNLEGLVAQRTEQYYEEKKKAEDLLYMMLPKSVAGQLIRGEPVTAEAFDKVTIYFSDICGFTSLSAESTPWQVINLLNDLYTLFDSIIENFDCYKVETIGDAYMVVSGLPQRNGNLHAREVARMALSFLKAIFSFKIRHRPDRRLKLRIGIHSGPVIAGVVGLKMPRYCLFGDTVNMASRMESNGEPLRIHASQSTKDVLDSLGYFILESRGYVEMKGKGRQKTYWLLGENDQIVDHNGDVPPDLPCSQVEPQPPLTSQPSFCGVANDASVSPVEPNVIIQTPLGPLPGGETA